MILGTLKPIADEIELLVHGGARGADKLAGICAMNLGLVCKEVRANWRMHGKTAGPIRNQRMIDLHKPTHAIAFHDDIENSKGTADMVRRLRKERIPVEVIGH